MSKAVVEWFKKAQASDTLPTEVKEEMTKLATKVSRLSARNRKTKNFLATELLTKGFAVTTDF